MPSIARLLAVGCLTTALASPAESQLAGYYPMGADSLSLTNDDFRILIDAANELLRRSPLGVGATASWRNGQTGSNGTVSVTKTFTRNAMLCHTLVYDDSPRQSHDPRLV